MVCYFNSIKVRLRLEDAGYNAQLAKFQFHKGSIKTKSGNSPRVKSINFNSIKVRLRPNITVPIREILTEFQFHKGSIKTLLLSSLFLRSFLISIP